jgi:hypothetical protein
MTVEDGLLQARSTRAELLDPTHHDTAVRCGDEMRLSGGVGSRRLEFY